MAELFMLVGVIVTVLLMIACWLEVRAQHSNDGETEPTAQATLTTRESVGDTPDGVIGRLDSARF